MLSFADTRYLIPAKRKCTSESRPGVSPNDFGESACPIAVLGVGPFKATLTDVLTEDTTTTAYDALRKGLEDMLEACDVVTEKFTAARDEFEASKQ